LLEANLAFFINHHQRRDAPQFEQVNFLSIKIGDDMLGVRQTNEGQVFNFPVTHKRFGAIGADCQNDRVTRGEGRKIIAQAREMSAAVRSQKPAQEDQNDILLPCILRKAYCITVYIGKFKIGSDGKNFHGMIPFRKTGLICQASGEIGQWPW
jgi:hypothetical protein